MITRQMSHRPQSGGVHENPELQNLTDYSPSDAPWDAHRSVSDDVGGIYLLAAEYERYGARMASLWRFTAFRVVYPQGNRRNASEAA